MKIKQLIFIFIIVLVAGYSGFWLYQASNGRAHIAEEIQKLNDKNSDLYHIHYDTIELAGFPFSFQLNVIQPVLEVRKAAQIKAVSIDGALSFSRPVFAKNRQFVAAVDDVVKAETEVGQFLVKGEHSILFDRQMAQSYSFSDLEIFAQNDDQMRTCLKIAKGNMHFDDQSTDLQYSTRVDFAFTDFAVNSILPPDDRMPLMKEALDKIAQEMPTKSQDEKGNIKGKIQIEADKSVVNFNQNDDSQIGPDAVLNFTVEMDMTAESITGSADYQCRVSLQKENNAQTILHISLGNSIELTEKWSQSINRAIDILSNSEEFLDKLSEKHPAARKILENNKELIKQLVPDMASLGKNIIDMDLLVTYNQENGQWSCNIPKLLYKNDLFGSKVAFDIRQQELNTSPEVVGALSIKNIDAMLDAFIGYLNKGIAVYNEIHLEERPLGSISTKTKNIIEKSLKSLGKKKKQILTISFQSKDGQVEIGQVPLNEFVEAFLPLYFLILQDISQQNDLML